MIGLMIGLYIASVILGLLLFKSRQFNNEREWKDDDIILFIPGINFIFLMTPLFYIVNMENIRTDINKYIASWDLELPTFLDEESQRELNESREQMENAIKAAKRLHTNQREIIKRKSEKRKLCNKLGLTLEDLETIKESRVKTEKVEVPLGMTGVAAIVGTTDGPILGKHVDIA